MYSLDSAVDTDRRSLANRVKLPALTRFHAGPDHVHSERCPVKRATFREEPGATLVLPGNDWPRFTSSFKPRKIRQFQLAWNDDSAIQRVLLVAVPQKLRAAGAEDSGRSSRSQIKTPHFDFWVLVRRVNECLILGRKDSNLLHPQLASGRLQLRASKLRAQFLNAAKLIDGDRRRIARARDWIFALPHNGRTICVRD
jgi:hypothetical protein